MDGLNSETLRLSIWFHPLCTIMPPGPPAPYIPACDIHIHIWWPDDECPSPISGQISHLWQPIHRAFAPTICLINPQPIHRMLAVMLYRVYRQWCLGRFSNKPLMSILFCQSCCIIMQSELPGDVTSISATQRFAEASVKWSWLRS